MGLRESLKGIILDSWVSLMSDDLIIIIRCSIFSHYEITTGRMVLSTSAASLTAWSEKTTMSRFACPNASFMRAFGTWSRPCSTKCLPKLQTSPMRSHYLLRKILRMDSLFGDLLKETVTSLCTTSTRNLGFRFGLCFWAQPLLVFGSTFQITTSLWRVLVLTMRTIWDSEMPRLGSFGKELSGLCVTKFTVSIGQPWWETSSSIPIIQMTLNWTWSPLTTPRTLMPPTGTTADGESWTQWGPWTQADI